MLSYAMLDLLRWVDRNGHEGGLADWYLDGHCSNASALAWRNADRVVAAAERKGLIAFDGDAVRLTDLGRRMMNRVAES